MLTVWKRTLAGFVAVVAATFGLGAVTPARAQETPGGLAALRDVVLVGNSVGGTVSFLDGRTFAVVGSFNAIPDLQQRLAEMTPGERLGYETARAQLGDRFVDDLAVAADGRTLYVSRANLADLVAFDLGTHQQLWRFKVAGIHADHLALSPDGARIVISASTEQKAQVVDARTGGQVGTFATGAYPHANDYSPDGRRIYNASIGVTALPWYLEFLKGPRQLTVVDAQTLRVVRTYTFDHGIRPAVFTPDEKIMYAQLSYLNGFVEYDLTAGRILRTVNLPYSPEGQALGRDSYPQNSAHHGMALSGDNSKLCVAGTIDDYVAIISRPALSTDRVIPVGDQPYWATTSVDGQHCVVTNSKSNSVSVIDYRTAQEVARIPVGNFPQRERLAQVSPDVLPALAG